jgi:hypothetical protein
MTVVKIIMPSVNRHNVREGPFTIVGIL